MAMNLALSSERFKGDRPPHCKKKSHLLGPLFPVNPTVMHLRLELVCGDRGQFLAAAAMVMGVLLAVGWGAYISTNPISRNSRNLPA
jgi:hypothetical protein